MPAGAAREGSAYAEAVPRAVRRSERVMAKIWPGRRMAVGVRVSAVDARTRLRACVATARQLAIVCPTHTRRVDALGPMAETV